MEQLIKYYGGALHHHIKRIVTDDGPADEILQDVLLKVWVKIDSYNPGAGRPFTWMVRIARNQAIDYLRSAAAGKAAKTDAIPDYVTNSSKLSEELYIDHIGLKKVVDELKADHRILIEFLYFRGHSQSETAKALDIPLGTVKTRSRKAIQQLRNLLNKDIQKIWLPLITLGGHIVELINTMI